MRHKTALLVAVFAVAFVAGVLVVPPASAIPGPGGCWVHCQQTYSYTATLTGHGIDCNHAEADLTAQLNAAVSGECQGIEEIGFCEKTIVITQGCSCNGCCDYVMSGYMKYRCKKCTEI